MVGKSTYLQVIPQQSTQNTADFPLQTYEKNQCTFLLFSSSVDFSLCNNFANSDSFAKVSVHVHIYNSLMPKLNYAGVVTLHYSINQSCATTHPQLYLGSQTTCATVVEK